MKLSLVNYIGIRIYDFFEESKYPELPVSCP